MASIWKLRNVPSFRHVCENWSSGRVARAAARMKIWTRTEPIRNAIFTSPCARIINSIWSLRPTFARLVSYVGHLNAFCVFVSCSVLLGCSLTMLGVVLGFRKISVDGLWFYWFLIVLIDVCVFAIRIFRSVRLTVCWRYIRKPGFYIFFRYSLFMYR